VDPAVNADRRAKIEGNDNFRLYINTLAVVSEKVFNALRGPTVRRVHLFRSAVDMSIKPSSVRPLRTTFLASFPRLSASALYCH
jgi:hypothetical protein